LLRYGRGLLPTQHCQRFGVHLFGVIDRLVGKAQPDSVVLMYLRILAQHL
jgi:hypothetical protein